MEGNKYQIFIASSLRLLEHREAVSMAIDEVNDSAIAKEKGITFVDFRYENRPDISQKLEKYDAQAPVDHALRQSSIFFLIIDDEVRSLTQYEFELALQRFNRSQMPQFIFIFHKNGTAKIGSSEGISYKQLEKEYNLNEYYYDSKGRTVNHKKIYDIPFDSLMDGEKSLKSHVKTQLSNLIIGGELPYSGAVLGIQLDKKDFFGNDTLRLINSPTVYYRRSIVDDKLDEALENSKVVLLTGNSLSGKTRAVMESLRATNNGWVYVLSKETSHNKSKTEQLIARINGISDYMLRNLTLKLYIVIDDIGQMAKSNRRIKAALEELVSAVLEPESHGVLVATATEADVSLKGIEKNNTGVEVLYIPEMNENDFVMAAQYFRSCGIAIDNSCFRYRTIGALFVDLKELRTRYCDYLSVEEDDETTFDSVAEQNAAKYTRKRLLRAIKAQSIWRDDFFGDLNHLRKLTHYFLTTDECPVSPDNFDLFFNDAVRKLCAGGKLGVTMSDENMIEIQEYVYKHFIGYDGALQNNIDCSNEAKSEKILIRHILQFCHLYLTEEPLVFQVSRLTSRCQYKNENVEWLYNMWFGICMDTGDEELVSLLQIDRKLCETQPDLVEGSIITHHYSKIIENYIYSLCSNIDMAWEAFSKCPEQLRTDHLLSSVMQLAQSDEQRCHVMEHKDYLRLRNKSYVVRAEVEWASNYNTAAKVLMRIIDNESPSQVAERLLRPNELQYDIFQLVRATNTLFKKVVTEHDFDNALTILRQCFVKLIKDHTLLEKIRSNQLIVVPEQLTIIDLLARVNTYELGICLEQVYGGDIDSSMSLLSRLTSSLSATIAGGYTSETEVRLLISRIGSWLIKSAAKKGSYYDNVYNSLFTALKIPHPTKKGTDMIFRSSYTYTAMMLCKDCDIVKATNLFENDLVQHANDASNPLFINRYTLNELLKKSSKEDKSYLHRVNMLFTHLEVERDEFSYYNLLRGGKDSDLSLNECIEIIRQMNNSHVKPNVFILTAIMSCKDINLSMALSFMQYPAGILNNYKVDNYPKEIQITPELKDSLSKSDEAWSQVVSKPCPTKEDKDIITQVIEYLERPENVSILHSGKVYNALVNNHDYKSDTNAVVDYIREKHDKGYFCPDSYTICHVLDKVSKESGDPRRRSLYKLNGLLKENPALINDSAIINKRLMLYTSHMEQLPILFVRPNSQIIEEEMNPIKNAETMQLLNIRVDKFFIRTFTSKRINGLTDAICIRLMQVLQAQATVFPYDSQTSEAIRERLGKYLDLYPLSLEPLSALSHNKNVTRNYLQGIFDINTALSQLKWTNENSATTEFNAIIYHYIKGKKIKDASLFEAMMGYYNQYFGNIGKHRPSSYTFSALVQAVSSVEDFNKLLIELRKKRDENPRITPQPMMLARLSAKVHNIDELARETKSFINDGGEADEHTADLYLHRIANFLTRYDKEKARELITDVFRYIILGGDADKALRFKEREYLFMTFYENPDNVHAESLFTLITNNHKTINPLKTQEIVNGIAEKYEKQIPMLMNLLAGEKNLERIPQTNQSSTSQIRKSMYINEDCKRQIEIQKEFLPLLFMALKTHSNPKLSAAVILFLAKQLPRYDINAYNSFLRQMYTVNCTNIDDAVPVLINCIHRLSENLVHNKSILNAIRKTEAQVFTYAELNRLRCGHLLIEKAPCEFEDWCHASLKSEYINTLLEEKFSSDRVTIKDRIKFSISNLDDAYPCSLMTLRKHHLTKETIDSETRRLIEKQEVKYTKSIDRGDVKFRQMNHLPLLWIRAGWLPSEVIFLAMIRAYIKFENENSLYYDYVTAMLQSLTTSIAVASIQKSEKVKVCYAALGKFKTEVKTLFLLPIRILSAAIYQPLLERWKTLTTMSEKPSSKQVAGFKNVEYYYAEYLTEQPSMKYVDISVLPAIWSETGWRPQSVMVKALIANYTFIYTHNLEGCNEAATLIDMLSKAKAYAEKSKQPAKLSYRMLGGPEKCHGSVIASAEALSQSLPHKYILLLRWMVNSDSHRFPTNEIKKVERHFCQQLANTNVCPPLVLPELWHQTNIMPSTSLVIALIKSYVNHAQSNNRLRDCLDSINKAYLYAKKKGFEKTKINFVSLGCCPSTCSRYILINTQDIKNALTDSFNK